MGGSHKISDESIALAYKHAEQIAQGGKRLEQVGVLLSRSEQLTPQERNFIREAAQQIQDYAKAMLEHIKIAESDAELSTSAFAAAVTGHVEAMKLHTKINEILLKSDPMSSESHSNRQS